MFWIAKLMLNSGKLSSFSTYKELVFGYVTRYPYGFMIAEVITFL